jgi:hypothetical protein
LAAVFIAAVSVAVVISNSTSNTAVHLRQVVGNDWHSIVTQVRDLINANTAKK